MNMRLTAVLFLNSLFLLKPSFAEVNPEPGNYWQCTAYDARNRQWLVNSVYELTAVNKAYEACKKQSDVPASCKIAREDCEVFVDGVSTRPMWRCTALDHSAKPWRSGIQRNRESAALAAKARCKAHSALPETCYINLITCRNLNLRD